MTTGATSTGEGAARGVDALPRTFGRYVLFDHIGRGGMADIYLAHMRTSLGGARNVVVKEILPSLGEDESFRRMLTAEAKLAAKLNHANVVQVFDFGEQGDRLFIAMDYVEGFDLAQLLKRLSKAKVPLPAEFAVFIVREVLRGLDYAHRAKDESGAPLGIVHRDVSPSNVLISFEGEVKLCDFGIARAARGGSSDESAMRKTRVVGKSAYMAPEHARGDAIDERADLYAAGILLWELCAGRRLHKGTEEEMLAAARAAVVPPLPSGRLPNQDALQAVLDRALAADRDARFPTCASFLDALEEWALGAKLMASPLRFGSFLTERFAEEILSLRRERERLAVAEVSADVDPATFGPSSSPPPMLEGAATDKMPRPPQLPADLIPPPGAARDEVTPEPSPPIPPPPPAAPNAASVLRGGPARIASPPPPATPGKPAFAVRPPSAFAKAPTEDEAALDGEEAAALEREEATLEREEAALEAAGSAPRRISSSPPTMVAPKPAFDSGPTEAPGDAKRVSSSPPTVVGKATPMRDVPRSAPIPLVAATPEVREPTHSASGTSPSSGSVSRPLGAPPRPPPRTAGPSKLTPFTPTWYALVLLGAVAFGWVVYFVLRP